MTKQKFKHAPVEEGNCVACHKPHDSPNKALLVKAGATLCYECHDQFKGKHVHSPVEEGDCQACHKVHDSPIEHLLAKSSPDLCYGCHEKKDVDASKNHSAIAGKSCLSCHDPHKSEKAGLIK